MRFCWRPPHHPRLRQGILIRFCRGTPTPPAPSALLPRPLPGAGSGRGDTWWEAVSGSSPGSPHAVDRGDIATGGGADGEGEPVPPPLSPTLQPSYFSPASLARTSAGDTHPLLRPPTPPAPAALRPHPRGGQGQCLRYQGSSRARGGASGKPYPALFRLIPVHWTVGISPRGEGPTGRGLAPSPVSYAP